MWTSLAAHIPVNEAMNIVMGTTPLRWLYQQIIEGSCARQPNEKEPPKLYLDEIEVSLEDFEQRWSTPASHPDTGPEPEIVSEMTDALAHGTLKETARLFHQTCPDDWTLEINVAFGAKLQSYYEHGQDKEQAPMLAATIRFRWEMGLLTDYLVSLFDLPMPCNEICILWCQRAWQDTMDMTDSAWKVRWDRIENALGSSFDVLPREDQGPPSYRPRWYLTAALVEADRSEDETLTIISAAGHFTEILKEFHYEYYEY
ncbi:hypothetical protein N7513_002810 [Penicillium frequentans]|nr:hypothetical protein N7513_002810 [Penicillium glabrum]